jgi:hypothetical protein
MLWHGGAPYNWVPRPHIPGRVTAVPGVADLHHPAALAAAHQARQQRCALAGGTAAVVARGLVVGPQPGLVVLPGAPAQRTPGSWDGQR